MDSNEELTLEIKIKENIWDHINDFLEVYKKSKQGNWIWWKNNKCKYVELRIDMRNGDCIIRDRDGRRINPKDLEYQFEKNDNTDQKCQS